MGELGSIFDDQPGASDGARGPDVRVRAPVPEPMLAQGEQIVISVPEQVPFEGRTVPRRLGPGDRPGEVRLHLSPQLKDGVTLRLRGQGGEHPSSGRAGDLLVTIDVVPPEPVPWPKYVALAVAVIAAAGAVAWWGYGALGG